MSFPGHPAPAVFFDTDHPFLDATNTKKEEKSCGGGADFSRHLIEEGRAKHQATSTMSVLFIKTFWVVVLKTQPSRRAG